MEGFEDAGLAGVIDAELELENYFSRVDRSEVLDDLAPEYLKHKR